MKSKYLLIFVFTCMLIVGCSDRDFYSGKFISVPDGLLAFGNVAFGGDKTASLLLTNEKKGIIEITDAKITGANADDFEFVAPTVAPSVIDPIVLDGKGSQIAVFIKVTPSEQGIRSAQVEIEFGGTAPLIVDLIATSLNAKLVANPPVRDFLNTMITNTTTEKVVLSNPTVADLTITDLSISGDCASEFTIVSPASLPYDLAPLVIQGLGQVEITLMFEPIDVHPRTAFLDITSNMDGMPGTVMQVELIGIGLNEFQTIEADPEQFDFRRVDLGYFEETEIQLFNWGVPDLTITDVTIAMPFEIVEIVDVNGVVIDLLAAPAVVVQGECITVKIKFTPTDLGYATQNLVVTSDTDNVPATVTETMICGVGGDENDPFLYAGPVPFNLEDTLVGEYIDVEIYVYNYGTGSLIFTDVYNDNDVVFEVLEAKDSTGNVINNVPFSIETNDYIVVTLRFTPAALGQDTTTFTFETNSGGVPGTVETYVITGNGI